MRLARLVTSLVMSCVDYSPTPVDEPGEAGLPRDSGPPDTGLDVDEICDGYDNNGDGQVDEGFPDSDSDGHADCVDTTCGVYDADSAASETFTGCAEDLTLPVDPWDIEVLWESDEPKNGCIQAAVADLDHDGIVEIACSYDDFVVVDGQDGGLEWTSDAFGEGSPVVAADLDGDGYIDLIGMDAMGHIVALEGTGAVKWTSDVDLGTTFMGERTHSITATLEVVDLDGDGAAEVISHHGIVSGQSGALLGRVSTEEDNYLSLPDEIVAADIDRDTVPEIVFEWKRYSASGVQLWEYPYPEEYDTRNGDPVTPAVLQLDLDDEGEIVWIAPAGVVAADPDGSTLLSVPALDELGLNRGLPCAAALTGNGLMDVIWSDARRLMAMDAGGKYLWSSPAEDVSTATGCAVFDFDLDGVPDVVYSDEVAVYFRRGTDGWTMYQEDWSSGTVGEHPIIVDLDGDGSVEVLFFAAHGGDGVSIRAYGNTNRDWPPGDRIWPTRTWSGTSHNPDGTIPRTADAPWLTTGIWRGQPVCRDACSDVYPEIVDTCVASCDNDAAEVRLSIRLVNAGPLERAGSVPVAVYLVDADGGRSLLEVHDSAALLGLATDTASPEPFFDNGLATATFEVELTLAQARHGVVVVAGDDGTGAKLDGDCDPSNDAVEWQPGC